MHNTIVKGWLPGKNDKKGKRKRNNLIKNGRKSNLFGFKLYLCMLLGQNVKGGGWLKCSMYTPWNIGIY